MLHRAKNMQIFYMGLKSYYQDLKMKKKSLEYLFSFRRYEQTNKQKKNSLFSYLNGTKCLQKSVQISYYIQ